MITIKNLSKTFETAEGTVEALNDINLTINDGDIYGIIGMSGAGKSLLVHDDVDTMEQVYAKVRDLTAAQLTEVAEAVFSNMSRLIYK